MDIHTRIQTHASKRARTRAHMRNPPTHIDTSDTSTHRQLSTRLSMLQSAHLFFLVVDGVIRHGVCLATSHAVSPRCTEAEGAAATAARCAAARDLMVGRHGVVLWRGQAAVWTSVGELARQHGYDWHRYTHHGHHVRVRRAAVAAATRAAQRKHPRHWAITGPGAWPTDPVASLCNHGGVFPFSFVSLVFCLYLVLPVFNNNTILYPLLSHILR